MGNPMQELRANWLKPIDGDSKKTDRIPVSIHAFMQLSVSDSRATRPVAIIDDPTANGQFRYVELKFLEIIRER